MKTTSVILSVVATGLTSVAIAAPPPHAPAHGWRRQHDGDYVGYSGRHWEQDYGIVSGHCNREAISTVLGSVAGAVIGSRVADAEDRAVATIVGGAIGALIGNKIGEELDEADRGCVGHALEVASAGQRVAWMNESTGVSYEITPGDRRDRNDTPCREFTLLAVAGRTYSRTGIACQSQAGVWQFED